jgi:hypothetical protein
VFIASEPSAVIDIIFRRRMRCPAGSNRRHWIAANG